MTNTGRAVKTSSTNLATLGTEQGAGFLSFPREFVRTCWRFLRLREIAFLVALVDLADGRWTLPIALAQLARMAHLSAGNAREAAQQLAAAGVIAREPTAPGVYRWSFAAPADWLTVASKLAHRGPKPRPVSRPAQTSLPLDAGSLVSPPPPPPPPSSPPRPRLALVGALAMSPSASPAPPEVRAAVEAEALAGLPLFDGLRAVPPPPPAPATERCPPPDFDDDGIPGVEVPEDEAPPTDRAALLEGPPPGSLRLPPPPAGGLFGLLAGGGVPLDGGGVSAPPALVRASYWRTQDDPPEAAPNRDAPAPPSAPRIGTPPAPNRDAPPPRIGTPPRLESGRPYLMISKTDPRPDPKPVPSPVSVGAHAHEAAPEAGGTDGRDGTGVQGLTAAEAAEELGELAASLTVGLSPRAAAGRIKLVGAEVAAETFRRFLAEQVPEKAKEGARHPFGAALSGLGAWLKLDAEKLRKVAEAAAMADYRAKKAASAAAEALAGAAPSPGASRLAPRDPVEVCEARGNAARAALEHLAAARRGELPPAPRRPR